MWGLWLGKQGEVPNQMYLFYTQTRSMGYSLTSNTCESDDGIMNSWRDACSSETVIPNSQPSNPRNNNNKTDFAPSALFLTSQKSTHSLVLSLLSRHFPAQGLPCFGTRWLSFVSPSSWWTQVGCPSVPLPFVAAHGERPRRLPRAVMHSAQDNSQYDPNTS